MAAPLPFRIIPCAEWGAAPPKHALSAVDKPVRGIFHHTAGHVPNLSAGETYLEACAYARAIQRMHMAKGGLGAPEGGSDSGHNFLITRGGYILEGRHRSVSLCSAGRMVASAHCPTQNDQPGVEHEHNGTETMTPIQFEAAVWLWAKLCRWGGFKPAMIAPHKQFFATGCPGTLQNQLPRLRVAVSAQLAPVPDKDGAWWDDYGPKKKPAWFFKALREYQRRLQE